MIVEGDRIVIFTPGRKGSLEGEFFAQGVSDPVEVGGLMVQSFTLRDMPKIPGKSSIHWKDGVPQFIEVLHKPGKRAVRTRIAQDHFHIHVRSLRSVVDRLDPLLNELHSYIHTMKGNPVFRKEFEELQSRLDGLALARAAVEDCATGKPTNKMAKRYRLSRTCKIRQALDFKD